MDTLPRTLQYSPGEPVPLWLFDILPRREFILSPYIEKTFVSLSGKFVVFENGELFCSLAQGGAEWVFLYGGSMKNVRLTKPGTEEAVDISTELHALFCRMNRKEVSVEADENHFKISAA